MRLSRRRTKVRRAFNPLYGYCRRGSVLYSVLGKSLAVTATLSPRNGCEHNKEPDQPPNAALASRYAGLHQRAVCPVMEYHQHKEMGLMPSPTRVQAAGEAWLGHAKVAFPTAGSI
jgi:hypothetical protein